MTEETQLQFAKRFWTKVRLDDVSKCWNWQAAKVRGTYGKFAIHHKLFPAHRIAYELVYGPIPDGLFVRHTCDNKSCCNPFHLLAGTHQDNVRDAIERRRYLSGKDNKHAKYPSAIVSVIRRLSEAGCPPCEIARVMGIRVHYVYKIRQGKTRRYG